MCPEPVEAPTTVEATTPMLPQTYPHVDKSHGCHLHVVYREFGNFMSPDAKAS